MAGYIGPLLFNKSNDFYIHLHKENIGRAGGNPENRGELVEYSYKSLFESQKKKIIQSVKSQYTQLFLKTVKNKINSKSFKALKELMKTEEGITQINNNMQQYLQGIIDSNNVVQKIMKERVNISNLKNNINNILKDSKESINTFSNVLDHLNTVLKIITGNSYELKLAILQQDKKSVDTKDIIKAFGKTLSSLEGNIVSSKDLTKTEELIKSLANIGKKIEGDNYAIDKKTKKQKKDLAILVRAVFNMIDSWFVNSNKVFETIMTIAYSFADGEISKAIGSNLVLGEGNKFKRVRGNMTMESSGKTDLLTKNVKMSVSYQTKGKTKHIKFTMDLGTSLKFYKDSFLQDSNKKKAKRHFSSGSGGSLGEAIHNTFSKNRERYLAYNILVRNSSERKDDFVVLQDLIFTRQIIRLFGSRSGTSDDFSQFIILNEEVVPLWDLILHAIGEDAALGYSKSMRSKDKNNNKWKNSGLTVSLKEKRKTVKLKTDTNTPKRVSTFNNVINTATIQMEVHLQNLQNSLKKGRGK